MTARKAATKLPPRKGPVLPEQSEAATFDVAAWLDELKGQGFKPRNIEVPFYIRGELLPRINALVEQIQQLQDGPEREEGIDDSDPIVALTAEYEKLVDEFHAGGSLTFEFRPINKRIHNSTYREWVDKYGERPADPDVANDALITARMAATCVRFPGIKGEVTPAAFEAFEDRFGMPAFARMRAEWMKVYEIGGETGGEVAAPFLQKPSPTPSTAE